MCHRITCFTCGRPTWEGCGEHIDQALAGVSADERCHCHAASQEEQDGDSR